ncbi:MAG: reverse transcriptase/maturase family protein [Patescibacteria group bacterium]
MNGKIKLSHTFEDIICLDNLLLAWQEFVRGKRGRKDAQEFQLRLMDNLIALHRYLATGVYRHGGYQAFKICDPKPRQIHKASVRDRLVHHAIYRILYPFFDRTFIADSYSCRLGKGTHKALARFREFAYAASKNNTRTCWILKGDIRKFFANIDHRILKEILAEYIPDKSILGLLDEVIDSFDNIEDNLDSRLRGNDKRESGNNGGGRGLPLGNLTSQLLVNIYMNKFDQFVKHKLQVKHYIRYADDFVIMADDKEYLENIIPIIDEYLRDKMKLMLHPDKLFIKTLNSGLDFLGWVTFFDHRVFRTTSKRRMFRRVRGNHSLETINSYLGLLSHGQSYKLQRKIANLAYTC